MGKTAKSLGEGDFVGAAQHIVGSTKTTTSPFNIKRTPEAQDVKIDKLWRGAESYTKGTANRLLFDAGETLLSR